MRALALVIGLISLPAFAADNPTTGGPFQPWTAVIAAAVGAVIAGAFAIWQSVRNAQLQKSLAAAAAQSQRDLEVHKSDLARLQSDLERSKQAAYEFRVQRLAPFAEALNSSIVESYSAVVGLPLLAKFKNHMPAMIKQRDKDMAAWLESMQAMSRQRVQVLLSIASDAVEPLIRLIEHFVQLQKKLIETRNLYLSDHAPYDAVVAAHSEYVRAGFTLLLQTRNALGAAAGSSPPEGGDDGQKFLKEFPELLERSSIVSLNYGKVPRNAWMTSWTVSAGILKYEGLGWAEFEQAIQDVGVAINQIDDAIDVKVARQGSADDQERDYALCVSFVDDASLQRFISTTLPVIKRQSKVLWKGLVTPVEATVD